jgi:hypothetical protein
LWPRSFGKPSTFSSLLLLRALLFMMNLGLFYDCSPFVHIPWLSSPFCCFRPVAIAKSFLWGGVVNPRPNPQPGGPGYLFLSGSSDTSGMRDSTSTYATAGIALRIIWPGKPHHYIKVGIPAGGGGDGKSLMFNICAFGICNYGR